MTYLPNKMLKMPKLSLIKSSTMPIQKWTKLDKYQKSTQPLKMMTTWIVYLLSTPKQVPIRKVMLMDTIFYLRKQLGQHLLILSKSGMTFHLRTLKNILMRDLIKIGKNSMWMDLDSSMFPKLSNSKDNWWEPSA